MSNKIRTERLEYLLPDTQNANDGNLQGDYQLEQSIQECGWGRSGLIDKHGNIIAGNKLHGKSGELGAEEAIIIESDGTKPIFVQRTDLDLYEDEQARMLAYRDNFVSFKNLSWNKDQIVVDWKAGVPVNKMWTDDELAAMLGNVTKPPPLPPAQKEMIFQLKVTCPDESSLHELFNRLSDEGWNCELEIK